MDCAECDKLWRVYAEATARYADLVNQQEITNRDADSAKLHDLEASVLGAAASLLTHWHTEASHYREQALERA